ncbi:MAG TPA: twin-arginine translocase TatA/TatE family subunit [Thermoanaerobaculia bacterium]
MFGLGVPELIFILVLALLIFGPKRLPEIGRTVGRGLSEFRKASNDLKRSINIELALDEPPPPPFPNRVDLPRIVQPPENQQVARTPSSPVEASDLPAADKPVEPS